MSEVSGKKSCKLNVVPTLELHLLLRTQQMKILFEKGDTEAQRLMAEALLKNGIVNTIEVSAGGSGNTMKSDAKIAQAITMVMTLFSVGAQWVAIYRVLVDIYGFPHEYAAFCQRIKDVMGGTECKYPCAYQSIQKGIGTRGIFSKPYREWCTYKPKKGDRVFPRQKMVADKLLELLEEPKFTMDSL